MDDDFDRALMDALNEAVPPVALSPGLADRLVARARRRSRLWKLFLALFAVSAAFGAAWTASELSSDDNASNNDMESRRLGGDLDWDNHRLGGDPTPQAIPSSTPGESQVNTTPLKSTAALAGAIALATAQPTAAAGDGYQYIVSGYPAANPKQVARSASTSLETGAYRIVSAADDLEARYRTCIASNATALRSDEFKAMIIIMR